MKLSILITVCSLYYFRIVRGQQMTKRLVCYYDAINPDKNVRGYPHHFEGHFLKALPNCTHLVYSYAHILPQLLEIRKYRLSPQPKDLKIQFPHLKIFLSLGGDRPELAQQYLQFLEAGERKQRHFIENVKTFLKFHHFDGLDLAFPFPRNKPRKVHNKLATVLKKFKKVFTGNQVIDMNAESHKLQYTKFVYDIKNEFLKANLQLSMTVLPNVNSTWYFDILKIHKYFEFINLFAFDFLTPTRNPEEADYSAPIYFKEGDNRLPYYNIEFQVDYWIHNGCPVQKLNLGISTYGRAWRLTIDSGLSGIPVVESTNGAADPGDFSEQPGLFSWPEICIKLNAKGLLLKAVDEERKYGNYAFRPVDKNNDIGIWISFDDPDFAGTKTEYVKQKGMGGVAVYDLLHDDFKKFCTGSEFPILSRISEGLEILQHQVHRNNLSFTYNNQLYSQKAQYGKFP